MVAKGVTGGETIVRDSVAKWRKSLLAAQAATMGPLFFGYFNDSLFWVVNRMMGASDVKQQMVVWFYRRLLPGRLAAPAWR